MNESYTAIRLDQNNRIVPRFIVRQIPFSSIFLPKRLKSMSIDPNIVKHTPFLDLPRWVIDPSMQINSFNIGTSDVPRFNFFQVYAQLNSVQGALGAAGAQYAQINAGNYAIDEIDISRHGVRTMTPDTGCGLSDPLISGFSGFSEIQTWTALVTDWYANGHLKLSGNINCVGISAPICVGDNLQIAGKLLHIESLTHNYEVTDGEKPVKSFSTTMDLAHGILTNGKYDYNDAKMRKNLKNPLAPGFSDEEVYINGQPIISSLPDDTQSDT
jgi:hypothetical protein